MFDIDMLCSTTTEVMQIFENCEKADKPRLFLYTLSYNLF